jgi:hypothetical protein
MVRMAHASNLYEQGLEVSQHYFQPQLLRLAIKDLKTRLKTFPHFIDNNEFTPLLMELNAYEVNEKMNEGEMIFKTIEEKNKTLKWFEKGTRFEASKSNMIESKYFGESIIGAGSPIHTSMKAEPKCHIISLATEEKTKLTNDEQKAEPESSTYEAVTILSHNDDDSSSANNLTHLKG